MSHPITFQELRKGMKARIADLGQIGDLSGRMLEMGLLPGTEFQVVKVAPLGDPVEIEIRGYRLCLRRSECGCLRLESQN